MRKRNIYFLLGATLTLIGYLIGYSQKSSVSSTTPIPLITPISQVLQASDSATLVKVIRVVDGDTIEVIDEKASGPEGLKARRVRYIGINTPETVAPGKPVACFGKEASDKNKELVLGKNVRLEKDVSETDRYGRLLRYVYVEDADNVGDTMINNELVREGYAQVSTYPPDVKYQNLFLESQKFARENSLGLWSFCLISP